MNQHRKENLTYAAKKAVLTMGGIIILLLKLVEGSNKMSKISEALKKTEHYTYVIAEISQNHDGSLGQAHAFIDAVAITGADAIKFQTHIADEESTKDEPFRVNFSYEDKTRYDYWKRMEFTEEHWRGLYKHATEVGLDFLSSAFSVKALNMLERIGVPAWKFGSGEVFNDVLLEKALMTNKPIILSTGMSTLLDIDLQVEMITKFGNEFILMQCTTSYPCLAKDVGINLIEEFKSRYKCHVGLSDHSATIFPSLAATTMGARAVEVHVTMSKHMFGPDVQSSITIDQLKMLVEGIRFVNTMKNNPYDKSKLTNNLSSLKNIFSKSIYASKDLKSDTILSEDNIAIKKPAKGIPSSEYKGVLGKKINKEIKKDSAIKWEDLI